MATLVAPPQATPVRQPQFSDTSPIAVRAMVFLVGVFLPLVTISRYRNLGDASLLTRMAIPDIICVLTVAIIIVSRQLKLHWTSLAYFGALCLSFVIAFTAEPRAHVITSMLALLMAYLYLLVGASASESPSTMRALLMGMLIGVGWEGVIVFHDYLLPGSRWFLGNENKIRGTFRASGQLAQYGFTMAGIMFCFGWAMFQSKWKQILMLIAGCVAIFFVFSAVRRSGIFAIGSGVAVYLVLGIWFRSKAYLSVLLVSIVGGIVYAVWIAQALEGSFLVYRLTLAVNDLSEGETFTQMQFYTAMDNFNLWFPMGTGVGRGYIAVTEQTLDLGMGEIHNGHLSIMVELGLLGAITFYLLCLRAAVRPLMKSKSRLGSSGPAVRGIVLAFLCAAAVFMIHNRLHRDRGFMIFLGAAPTLVIGATAAESQHRPVYARRMRRASI